MRVLKYNEAKLKIVQMIGEAGLSIGDKLPAERELVERLGVSIISVHRALEDLRQAGLIRKVQGVGSFLLREVTKAQHESVFGVVNVGDHLFPDGRRMYELSEAANRYHAEYRIFSVSHEVEPSLVEELKQCERFIITGFVNRQWVELLSGLGKPMVHLGFSEFEGDICRVMHDYSAVFRRLLNEFMARGRRKVVFLVSDPAYNSNVPSLRHFFRQAMEELKLPWQEELAPVISMESGIGDVMRTLKPLEDTLEAVITCDPASILPFTYAMRHLRLRPDLLVAVLQECNFQPRDVGTWWPELYNVYFEESVTRKAVEVLYGYPYSFIENHEVARIEPVIVYGKDGAQVV